MKTAPPPVQAVTTAAPPRRRDAVAGCVAVLVALAAAELGAGLIPGATSPLLAVGDVVVDLVPPGVKDAAIALFGTGDKIALIIGTLVLAGLIGIALGIAARRRFVLGVGGLVVFGALGVAAAAGDPRASVPATAIAVGLAVALGALALRYLLAAGAHPHAVGRRAFLRAVAYTVGGAAVVAAGGRWLERRSVATASRAALVVPEPSETAAALPAGTEVDVEGVTPFVTANEDFYRIDTALSVPRIDVETWRLKVTGMVDRPLDISFGKLVEMGLREHWTTLCCVSNEVGGRLIGNALWGGVLLADVLELAGVQLAATQIVARSVDGWTAGFPTAVARDGRAALIAVTMNGEKLPPEHGFPARLVVPGLYGYVSATKWLAELELTTWEAFDAYWIPRGWSKEGPIKTQSRIDVPRPGSVPAGPAIAAGVAWAQHRGIEAVEVRVDEGPWQPARLAEAPHADTWRQWVFEWEATPGSHVLEVRATDTTGEPQVAQRQPPAPDGATGYHSVLVQVSDT